MGAILWVFHWLGDGALATPPLSAPETWWAWAQGRAPEVAAFAVGRLLVLTIGWYLLAATALRAVAHLARARRLLAATNHLTIPIIRSTVDRAARGGVAVATVASVSLGAVPAAGASGAEPPSTAAPAEHHGSGSGTAEPSAGGSAAARHGVDGSAAHATMTAMAGASEPSATMDLIDHDPRPTAAAAETTQVSSTPSDGAVAGPGAEMTRTGESEDSDPTRSEGTDTAAAAEMTHVSSTPSDDVVAGPGAEMTRTEESEESDPTRSEGTDTASEQVEQDLPTSHEVSRGEHFWSIAEDTLNRTRAEAPDEGEIAAYWERLIEVNRDRLADPGNPDLLFPGQQIRLPEVS